MMHRNIRIHKYASPYHSWCTVEPATNTNWLEQTPVSNDHLSQFYFNIFMFIV